MTWWALGVDLGTTFSAAVVARHDGHLEVMDAVGERRTPSTSLAAVLDRFVAEGRRRFDGADPARLVLTHPASGTGSERDVLRDAAAQVLPGIPLTLIPEPVAAAAELAAGHELDAGARLAVFDLGGSRLDVTVLQAAVLQAAGAQAAGDQDQLSGGFGVIGNPQGAEDLGGDRFDRLLMDHFVAELRATTWWARTQAESGPASLRDLDELLRTARLLREALSERDEAKAFFAPAEVELHVTRASYDELIADDVERQMRLLEAALGSAGVTAEALAGIYFIGSASRTPAVRAAMQARYGDLIHTGGDPEWSVARGAARLALRAQRGAERAEPPAVATAPPPIAQGYGSQGYVAEPGYGSQGTLLNRGTGARGTGARGTGARGTSPNRGTGARGTVRPPNRATARVMQPTTVRTSRPPRPPPMARAINRATSRATATAMHRPTRTRPSSTRPSRVVRRPAGTRTSRSW